METGGKPSAVKSFGTPLKFDFTEAATQQSGESNSTAGIGSQPINLQVFGERMTVAPIKFASCFQVNPEEADQFEDRLVAEKENSIIGNRERLLDFVTEVMAGKFN